MENVQKKKRTGSQLHILLPFLSYFALLRAGGKNNFLGEKKEDFVSSLLP